MKLVAWRQSTVLAGLLGWPVSAEAHSPIEGLGTFYNYMLHPAAVLAHALLLVSVALMLGQLGRRAARVGLAALTFGFFAGLATSWTGTMTIVREPILLLGAFAAAAAVSLAVRPPSGAAALAAGLAGLCIGLDSAPNDPAMRDVTLAYAGLIAGTLWVVTIVTGLTVGLTKDWQRVGVRIAGSWIAAIAAIGLAFAFAKPQKHETAAMECAWKRDRQC